MVKCKNNQKWSSTSKIWPKNTSKTCVRFFSYIHFVTVNSRSKRKVYACATRLEYYLRQNRWNEIRNYTRKQKIIERQRQTERQTERERERESERERERERERVREREREREKLAGTRESKREEVSAQNKAIQLLYSACARTTTDTTITAGLRDWSTKRSERPPTLRLRRTGRCRSRHSSSSKQTGPATIEKCLAGSRVLHARWCGSPRSKIHSSRRRRWLRTTEHRDRYEPVDRRRPRGTKHHEWFTRIRRRTDDLPHTMAESLPIWSLSLSLSLSLYIYIYIYIYIYAGGIHCTASATINLVCKFYSYFFFLIFFLFFFVSFIDLYNSTFKTIKIDSYFIVLKWL